MIPDRNSNLQQSENSAISVSISMLFAKQKSRIMVNVQQKRSFNFIVNRFKKNHKGIANEIKDLNDVRKCS